jgi:hypothetical protein
MSGSSTILYGFEKKKAIKVKIVSAGIEPLFPVTIL